MVTLRDKVQAYINDHPGLTSNDVARMIGENRTSVSNALGMLHREGLLARYKHDRCYRYVNVTLVETTHVVSATVLPPAPAKSSTEVDELRTKLAELEAWRDAALENNPSLRPVDPLVLKARQIVADVNDAHGANSWAREARDGDHCKADISVSGILSCLRKACQTKDRVPLERRTYHQ